MRILTALVVLVAAVGVARAADERVPERGYTPVPPGLVQFSYSLAPLPLLPRRFINHCGFWQGHYICADHCGPDYQVFYCGRFSFGCCHIGRGYCDDDGRLHCTPALF